MSKIKEFIVGKSTNESKLSLNTLIFYVVYLDMFLISLSFIFLKYFAYKFNHFDPKFQLNLSYIPSIGYTTISIAFMLLWLLTTIYLIFGKNKPNFCKFKNIFLKDQKGKYSVYLFIAPFAFLMNILSIFPLFVYILMLDISINDIGPTMQEYALDTFNESKISQISDKCDLIKAEVSFIGKKMIFSKNDADLKNIVIKKYTRDNKMCYDKNQLFFDNTMKDISKRGLIVSSPIDTIKEYMHNLK